MPRQSGPLRSNHFKFEKLTEGVYAGVHLASGCGVCNVGIIDLGKQTLVFDTGLTPQAARDLRVAAVAFTGRSPTYVVNSHHHNDHIRGSQVFPEALLISTSRTRELIETVGPDDIKSDREQASKSLAEMKAMVRSRDKEKCTTGESWLPYWQGILDSMDELQLRLPELTFDYRLTFHGDIRTAQFLATKGGHTESDCLLYLPSEGIVFCGDLLFVKCHPYLGDCDSEALLSILAGLRRLKGSIYVPGHGPVGGKEDVDKLRLYVRMVMCQAKEAADRSEGPEVLARKQVPEPFSHWIMADPFYRANLRFLYERLNKC